MATVALSPNRHSWNKATVYLATVTISTVANYTLPLLIPYHIIYRVVVSSYIKNWDQPGEEYFPQSLIHICLYSWWYYYPWYAHAYHNRSPFEVSIFTWLEGTASLWKSLHVLLFLCCRPIFSPERSSRNPPQHYSNAHLNWHLFSWFSFFTCISVHYDLAI